MSIQETPEKNQVYFKWLNRYAGVTVKTPSATVVIDPVDVKPRDFKSMNAILITHEHYDHLDQALISEVQKQTSCMVIADRTSARKLRNVVPSDKLVEVQPGSEVNVGGVKVKAEECNHPPAMSPVSFIVTSEDGVKLYHTADSLPFPDMTKISDREKLDVVFCTVGIAPCTSPQTGVDIARLTQPKVAVPYHTGSASDQKKFAEILKNELPKVACLIPETGKIYEVSKRK